MTVFKKIKYIEETGYTIYENPDKELKYQIQELVKTLSETIVRWGTNYFEIISEKGIHPVTKELYYNVVNMENNWERDMPQDFVDAGINNYQLIEVNKKFPIKKDLFKNVKFENEFNVLEVLERNWETIDCSTSGIALSFGMFKLDNDSEYNVIPGNIYHNLEGDIVNRNYNLDIDKIKIV